MKAVHLAGDAVQVGSRVIQRCLICGEVLVDDEYPVMLYASPAPLFGPFLFDAGGWVEVEDNQTSQIGRSQSPSFESKDLLPNHNCLELVERVR